jgi:hypothetical protein
MINTTEKVIYSARDRYAILPAGKAVVTFRDSKQADSKSINVAPADYGSTDWSPWGDNNLFPQEVISDLEKNSISLRALELRKAVHFGRGIVAYREVRDPDTGVSKKQIVKDPEVVDFFRVNRINQIWPDLIGALEIFANGWIEFITNLGRNKINRLYIKDPAYCRLAKMNQQMKIPYLYYSAQWDRCPSVESGNVKRIPMYDTAKHDGKVYSDYQFAYPVFYRTFNKSYYHLAVWNGIRSSGWMNIANRVPELKKALMKNQMTLKYHITIPDDYFEKRYKPEEYTLEQRETKKKEILEEMDKFLSDAENSGKTFVSFAFWDKVNAEYLDGWKIDVIDNKLKDDAYLPDSQAANSEILFAMGVDPCLIGSSTVPGGKLGGGSGSNKREAFWMLNAEMGIYRAESLHPLYFIRDFNGWDQQIQFDYVMVDTLQSINADIQAKQDRSK